MVNDQRNPVYKEMVTLPDGSSLHSRRTGCCPQLASWFKKYCEQIGPRRLMKNLGFPKYAAGVGIPEDAKFLREMQDASKQFAFLK